MQKENSLTSAHDCTISVHSKGQPPSHGSGGVWRESLAGTLYRAGEGLCNEDLDELAQLCATLWSFLSGMFASGRTDNHGRHAVSANILSGLTNNCWTKPAVIFIGVLFFQRGNLSHPTPKNWKKEQSELSDTSGSGRISHSLVDE